MANNQAHADRLWDRMGRRGWLVRLQGPESGSVTKPYVCTAVRGTIRLQASGTNRVEAVVFCAELVEKHEKEVAVL